MPSGLPSAALEATFANLQRMLANALGGDRDLDARAARTSRIRALVDTHAYADHPPAPSGWTEMMMGLPVPGTVDRGTDVLAEHLRLGRMAHAEVATRGLVPPPWRSSRRRRAGVADYAVMFGDLITAPTAPTPAVARPAQREPMPWVYATEAEALRHVHELQDLILWCTNPTGDLTDPTKQFLFDSVIPMILNYIDEVHATLRGELRRPRSYEWPSLRFPSRAIDDDDPVAGMYARGDTVGFFSIPTGRLAQYI